MASRYWVGGTATWNATAGTKWAATSGGAGGQTVPTASDDVFFDANSGAVTVFLGTGNPVCRNLTLTGFTGTLDNNSAGGLTVSGDLVGASTMNFANWDVTNAMLCNGVSKNITSNGGTWPRMRIDSTASYSLQDALLCSGNLTLDGTFTTNNFNVTCGQVSNASSGSTGVISMGSSLWTINGAGGNAASWNIGDASITVNAGTSTIKITDTSNTSTTNNFGSRSMYNLWFDRGGSTAFNRIDGSNTFNQFKDTGTAAHEIRFLNSSTQTIADWQVNGNPGQLITIRSTGGSTQHNLVKSGGGVVSSSYLSVINSVATPGTTWYAGTTSTDAGNNSGWIFTAPPAIPSVKTVDGLANASVKTIDGLAIASVKTVNGLN